MLSNKKLVLFFTAGMSLKKWSEGGMLSREIKLYNELARHFDRIYFLTYGGEEENEHRNFLAPNIEILDNKRRINPLVYSFLAPFIHRKAMKEADIYKTNQMLGSWTAVIAKVLFRKKLIVRQGYQYSLFYKYRGKPFLKFISGLIELISYKITDEIIVTSQEDKSFIMKRYKISEEKISVIPNYVDTDMFKPLEVRRERQLVFVGRLDEQKNLFSLIDAVKGLDIKLVLIGKGPSEDALKKKVKDEGIENVTFAGVVPNERLPEELNKSEIFIQPSFYEGNPKTLLEAMACGLPVIGTNVIGIKEVIKHGENGYLCGTSVEAIKEAIEEVMRDEELRHRIGRNAMKTIIENYNLTILAEKELGLMEELLR